MNPIATFANFAWLASSLPTHRRFCRALQDPAETQQRLLLESIARHADCAYGKNHGFGKIRTYAEFVQKVPLTEYDNLKPWIGRIRDGGQQVLTSDPVSHLIPTSGSSGARKLIPFTAGLQKEFNAAIGPWMVDLNRRHPSVAFGQAYWSVTPVAQTRDAEQSAIPIGFADDSAYLGGARKRLVDSLMAAPSALSLSQDIEQFHYLALLCLLRARDLRLISVWHPSFLTLLLDALPAHWNSLLEDIRTGQCRHQEALPLALRRALRLRPAPGRASELHQAGPGVPESFWPHLKVISCWGDAQAELALTDLRRRFPRTVIQSKGLLATEACVTIPFAGKHPLAVCSHFFEFIDETGRLHLAHELLANETYEVVVTTGGGLWRYRLGDQVQVTGFVGNTPSLRFLGRMGNISDCCGEKLSEAFVAQAIREACMKMTAPPCFAMLAPELTDSGWHYTLYLEGIAPDDLATRLDDLLRRNPHYAYCRDLGQLQPLRIFCITSAGFETFAKVEMAAGRKLGDIKPRSLSDQKDWGRHFSAVDPKGRRIMTPQHI